MTRQELKETREIMDMNIGEMADRLNTPPGTYVKWENGQRRVPGFLDVLLPVLEVVHIDIEKKIWAAAIAHQKEVDAVIIGRFADGAPDDHIVTIEELQKVIRTGGMSIKGLKESIEEVKP